MKCEPFTVHAAFTASSIFHPAKSLPLKSALNPAKAFAVCSGGVFEETLESGQPILSYNGSTLISGSLEGSNTDIASEFSKMIVTQQAYSANTRVITTSQQMLQDAINIIR